ETTIGITTGIGEVPPAGMEGVALEKTDPRNPRELRAVERNGVGHDDEFCPDHIVACGLDDPALGLLVPSHLADSRLKDGAVIEIEFISDHAAIFANFRSAGVAAPGHRACFFKQWQINVALYVAGDSGITIPIPAAAIVRAPLDDPDAGDARLAQ